MSHVSLRPGYFTLVLGRVVFNFTWAHWRPERGLCTHSPQAWPWWRLFSIGKPVSLNHEKPAYGYRVWLYTRWGAVFADVMRRRVRA